MKPLPLENIRILDLSRVLAGPLAGMIPGDPGAEGTKAERSGAGSRDGGPEESAAGLGPG